MTVATHANRFEQQLARHSISTLAARSVQTMQVNLGKLCNQACRHCHVDAGPHQLGDSVNMTSAMVEQVIGALERFDINVLDITGGAPELNPNFRRLVESARSLGVRVMDRCNLTVLMMPGQEDLAEFLASQEVQVVASLPFYRRDRTDRRRPGL